MGRKVKNFDEEKWKSKCFEIVVEGNLHKFSQDEELKYFLLNRNDQVIVVLNLSAHSHEVKLSGTNLHEGYQEIFTKEVVKDIHQLNLPAWGYKVFVKKSAKK